MKIAGLQKNSTIDFPGRLSSVIFLAGCNYDCYYCHNRHLLDAEGKILKEEIFDFLGRRKGLIDGVVITGGEPSLYNDLPEFIADIKSMGYDVKLDTNGSIPQAVSLLIENNLLDYVAVDYKAPFAKYDLIDPYIDISINATAVRSTIDIVMSSALDYEIRTTMIPEITEDDFLEMAKSFPPFSTYALQKYRPVPEDPGANENRCYYGTEDIRKLAELIKVYQPQTVIRS